MSSLNRLAKRSDFSGESSATTHSYAHTNSYSSSGSHPTVYRPTDFHFRHPRYRYIWDDYENALVEARALTRVGRAAEGVRVGEQARAEFRTRMRKLATSHPRFRAEIRHILDGIERHDAEHFAAGAARGAASDAGSSTNRALKRTRSGQRVASREQPAAEATHRVSRHARQRLEAGRRAVATGGVDPETPHRDATASVQSNAPHAAADAQFSAAGRRLPVSGDGGPRAHAPKHSTPAPRKVRAGHAAGLRRQGSTETTADSTERARQRLAHLRWLQQLQEQRAQEFHMRRFVEAQHERMRQDLERMRVGG